MSISILDFEGHSPKIDPTVFVCDGVRIIGDVRIGKHSSVWFNAVIRGDVHRITIGERTNVQDLAMLHVTHKKYALTVGDNITIGHSAVLHGATLHDCCLVGIGAKVLDRCVVNSYSFVAAGAVLPEGYVVPEGVLVAGVPAKVIRELTDSERRKLEESAQNYIDYVARYRGGHNINTQD